MVLGAFFGVGRCLGGVVECPLAAPAGVVVGLCWRDCQAKKATSRSTVVSKELPRATRVGVRRVCEGPGVEGCAVALFGGLSGVGIERGRPGLESATWLCAVVSYGRELSGLAGFERPALEEVGVGSAGLWEICGGLGVLISRGVWGWKGMLGVARG